jgi:hypothetical protein
MQLFLEPLRFASCQLVLSLLIRPFSIIITVRHVQVPNIALVLGTAQDFSTGCRRGDDSVTVFLS